MTIQAKLTAQGKILSEGKGMRGVESGAIYRVCKGKGSRELGRRAWGINMALLNANAIAIQKFRWEERFMNRPYKIHRLTSVRFKSLANEFAATRVANTKFCNVGGLEASPPSRGSTPSPLSKLIFCCTRAKSTDTDSGKCRI